MYNEWLVPMILSVAHLECLSKWEIIIKCCCISQATAGCQIKHRKTWINKQCMMSAHKLATSTAVLPKAPGGPSRQVLPKCRFCVKVAFLFLPFAKFLSPY